MKPIKAKLKDAKNIYELVQSSIAETYPKYYLPQIVTFFLNYHNLEAITKDIEKGEVYILFHQNELVACGCIHEMEISRVYVSPRKQREGWGSRMMQFLEDEIAKNCDFATLDASLPGAIFYEKRGYQTFSHGEHCFDDGIVFVYEIAKKQVK